MKLMLAGVHLLCLLSFLLLSPQHAHANQTVIHVGAYENAPKIYRNANGEITGFWPELLAAMARHENWLIQYHWGSWQENLDRLASGEIDMLPDVAVTPARQQRYLFSEQSALLSWSALYISQNSQPLNSFFDLQNKSIAVVTGSVNYIGPNGIRFLARQFDIHCRFKEYTSYAQAFAAVQEQQADAAVTNKFFGEKNKSHYQLLETPFIFQPSSLNFALSRNNPQTPQLTESIDKLLLGYKNDTDSIYYQLLQKYFSAPLPQASLSLPPYAKYLIYSLLFAVLVTIAAIVVFQRKLRQVKQKLSQHHSLLLKQEQKYRFLLNNQQDAVFLRRFDAVEDNIFTEVNDAAAWLYGYSRTELLRMSPRDLTPAERWQEYLVSPHRKALQMDLPTRFEILNRKKNGELFHAEVNSNIIELENERYLLSSVRDISTRKKAEQEKQEYFQLLQSIASQLPGVIYKTTLAPDGSLSIPYISAAAQRIFGLAAEQIQQDSSVLFNRIHPADKDNIFNSIDISARNLHPWVEKYRIVRQDGSVRWIFANSIPCQEQNMVTWYGYSADITEQMEVEQKHLELERQLKQKHKMEAIGVLAGGMAHNFNNSLSIVLGNLEMSLRRLQTPDKCREYLDNAKKALLQSRDLVKQVMIYARNDSQQKKVFPICALVADTLKLLRSTIPTSVQTEQVFSSAIQNSLVHGDSGRLQDALINLCNNAVQAMDNRGKLSISVAAAEQSPHTDPDDKRRADDFLKISISDTGCGIPEQTIDKIFDPFFTTKKVGQGTGMGLATVKGIIEAHDGFIDVHSTIAQGTTFDLYLPISSHPLSTEAAANDETSPHSAHEHILLVDDDKQLTATQTSLLLELGYRVTPFDNGHEAIARLQATPHDFDLLITDQIMPELRGTELIEEVKKIRPDLPAILCTGYSQQFNTDQAKERGVSAICLKPLEITELAKAIRQCLDNPPAS